MVWNDEILLLLKPAPVPLKVDLLLICWLFMLSIMMTGTLIGLCFCCASSQLPELSLSRVSLDCPLVYYLILL